uniref:Reverse transcriptase domain-containing protein n=1 Tax=Plectus sambesii TaxID=2011161 RepID=A0A914WLJ4_9BILA
MFSSSLTEALRVQPRVFEGDSKQFAMWLAHFDCALKLNKVEEADKTAMLFCSLLATVQRMLLARCSPRSFADFTYEELLELLRRHYTRTALALADYHRLFSSQQSAAQLLQKDFKSLDLALEHTLLAETAQQESTRGGNRPAHSLELPALNQIQRPGFRQPQGSTCTQCGGNDHRADTCRFKTATCRQCAKVGHIARVCRSAAQNVSPGSPSKTNGSKKRNGKREKSNQVTVAMDHVQVSTLDTSKDTSNVLLADPKRMKVALSVNGHPVLLEYDTGAAVTVINEKTWADLGKPNLKQSYICCHDFNGNEIALKGQVAVELCHCSLNHSSSTTSYVFSVSPSPHPKGVEREQLINGLLNDFLLIFEPGLGHCTKVKAHLKLKKDARPKFIRARPLPFAVYEAVNNEIDRWEKMGIIQPVNHSEWAAPIVIAPKPGGEIRLCADFSTGLNQAIDFYQYPLPRPEELYQKLNGGVIFSKIDFSEAYLQVELDDDSKRLVVINTHKGLYRFNRLLFGVSSAPAIFQQIMEKMLTGIPGVGAYLDDLIICGSSQREHIQRLRQVLQRISKFGF